MTGGQEHEHSGGARVARVNIPVSDETQSEYETHVLPALVTIVVDWWSQYAESDRPQWSVSASSDDGIYVDAPDDDPQDAICCPRLLNDATLLIGWQKYRNPLIRDAKCEIAEKLIVALLRSELLRPHVDIEHMDDVAEDLGLYQQGSDYESEDDDDDNEGEADEEEDEADEEEDEGDDDEARMAREAQARGDDGSGKKTSPPSRRVT